MASAFGDVKMPMPGALRGDGRQRWKKTLPWMNRLVKPDHGGKLGLFRPALDTYEIRFQEVNT